MKDTRKFPIRHRFGRYYGNGMNEDDYSGKSESWHDKTANVRDVMIPSGKGQEEYIGSRHGEVKTYNIYGK